MEGGSEGGGKRRVFLRESSRVFLEIMPREQGPGSDSHELTLGVSGICGDRRTHTSNGPASAQAQSNVASNQQESIIHKLSPSPRGARKPDVHMRSPDT